MASANSVTILIDDLVTTTHYKVRDQIFDQVFKITPFLDWLMSKGKVREKMLDGSHWEYPVRFDDQNQNTQWFGRGATFSRTEKEHLTRLLFYPRNLGTSIVRYWDDDQKNRGTTKLIAYAEEKVETAKQSLIQQLEEDTLQQNSDSSSIQALDFIISTTPTTGSYGGVTRSTNAYLQNRATDFTGKTTGNDLIDSMRTEYNQNSIYKGNGRRSPDFILTTREIYQDYERICENLRIIQTNKSERATLGFGELAFKGAELFWSPECPSGNMYFLNSDTWEMPYDPQTWMEMTEWKSSVDNLERAAQILCRMQLLCTNLRKNSVIHSITATTS